jgi:hypothetical protein
LLSVSRAPCCEFSDGRRGVSFGLSDIS